MTHKKHSKKKHVGNPPLLASHPHLCSVCRKPLTTDSSLMVRGIWYCFDPLCRPEELQETPEFIVEDSIPKTRRSKSAKFSVTFWALLTVIMCGIIAATVLLREISRLTDENIRLRESRLTLLELVKGIQPATSLAEPLILSETTPRTRSTDTITRISPQRPQRRPITRIPQYHPLNSIPYCLINGLVTEKKVALTFDAGSLANTAPAILDTLASRSIKATMFLTGEFIRKFPDICRRIVAEGHECGNHTMGHLHLTSYPENNLQHTLPSINKALLASQLIRADELFFSVTGRHFQPLWRAPYGEFNRELCRWGYETGYLHIGWRQGRTWLEGLDSNDWIPDSTTPGYRSPEEFLEKIAFVAAMSPPGICGGIILMHLGTERKVPKTQAHRVLGKIIDTLHTNGYSIVPVSRLAASAGFDLALLRGRSDIQ